MHNKYLLEITTRKACCVGPYNLGLENSQNESLYEFKCTTPSLYYKLHQLRNFHAAQSGILDSRSVKQMQHSRVSCSTNFKSFNTFEAMNKHYCGDVLILMAVTVYLTSHL